MNTLVRSLDATPVAAHNERMTMTAASTSYEWNTRYTEAFTDWARRARNFTNATLANSVTRKRTYIAAAGQMPANLGALQALREEQARRGLI